MGPGRGREGERKWEGKEGKEGRRWEEKRREGREERGNGSMHPLGFSKVGAYVQHVSPASGGFALPDPTGALPLDPAGDLCLTEACFVPLNKFLATPLAYTVSEKHTQTFLRFVEVITKDCAFFHSRCIQVIFI